MILNNKLETKTKRKILRNNLTEEEKMLWVCIKGSKLNQIKFRRQHSIGHYILDFYAPVIKLCIELDGSQHFSVDGSDYDNQRNEYLATYGIKVIRFANSEIRSNLNGVLEVIGEEIENIRGKTTPSRLRRATPP